MQQTKKHKPEQIQKINFCGIDFGSKLAGTTVICYEQNNMLYFLASDKKEDADDMITAFLKHNAINKVFIDAPLSLPGVYSFPELYHDYFYRTCDRHLNAMSPMFLGGLTARAMKLKRENEALGVKFYETYPSALAKEFFTKKDTYKSKEANLKKLAVKAMNICKTSIRLKENDIISQHHLDALLCFVSGYRKEILNTTVVFGTKEEGMIYI